MQCQRLLKQVKGWYIHVSNETMAPARMVAFIEKHAAECDICREDPDLQEEIEKITNDIFEIINYHLGKIIYNKNITLSNVIENDEINFLNSKIKIVLSNRNYANINIDNLKIGNGIIENLDIYLEFKISDKELYLKKIDLDNEIKKSINHEIHHLIERYLTKINDSKYAESWKYGKRLQTLKIKYPEFDDIIHFTYLSLPHEMRSRVSHLHQVLKNIPKDKIIDYIKNSKEYKDADFLIKVDPEFLLKKTSNNFIKDFSVVFLKTKNKNYKINFLNYFKNIKRKNKTLKIKLLKTSFTYLNETFFIEDYFDFNIDYSKYIR